MAHARRAIIIGAGPGGLTAAIALRQMGVEAVVYERAAELREIGSGLTLWPNAMQALERLQLAAAIRAVSLDSGGMAMRSWRGAPLFDMSSATLELCFGGAGVALHRAELQGVLLAALGADAVRLGQRCVDVRQDAAGVTARFATGLEARADLLVGADGIRSQIRTALFGPSRLRYAGFTVWRGVTVFPLQQRVGLTSLGPGAQFGMFPMTGGRVYWFGSANAPEGEPDRPGGRKRELLERFQGWHDPIAALIAATDEPAILRNDIYDHDPLRRWSVGRATLLGDAAHPLTPNLGQGACLAIEDAAVLALCLRDEPEIPAALRAYEARRIDRARSITLQSRRMGQLGQWRNPLACWLRDEMIRRTPAGARVRQLQAMFQFEP